MTSELTAPKMSLYQIEDSLSMLSDERERAVQDGDEEAIAAIDKAIGEYLTKEAAKVTSYVALIRSREMVIAQADSEIARLARIQREAVADVERLKKTALDVMNRFGVKELKATPGGGLRIQGNGGSEPLEVNDETLRESFKRVNVTLSGDVFNKLRNDPAYVGLLGSSFQWSADNTRIREALTRGEFVAGAKLLDRGEHLRVL